MTATTQEQISIANAARQAGVTSNAVRQWLDSAKVEAVPTVYGRAVDRSSLESFLRQRESRARRNQCGVTE